MICLLFSIKTEAVGIQLHIHNISAATTHNWDLCYNVTLEIHNGFLAAVYGGEREHLRI